MPHPKSIQKQKFSRPYFFKARSVKLLIPVILSWLTVSQKISAQDTAILSIQNNTKWTISKHIYGHFSEHLGQCIYDGFWVDSTLPVAKRDRTRLDIVEALKKN